MSRGACAISILFHPPPSLTAFESYGIQFMIFQSEDKVDEKVVLSIDWEKADGISVMHAPRHHASPVCAT